MPSIEKFLVLIIFYSLLNLQYICYAKLTANTPISAQKHVLYNNDSSEYNFLITGGYRPSEAKLTKYLVSLRSAKYDYHFCGGSIISPKVILTAAHCICEAQTNFRIMPEQMYIIAGTTTRLEVSNSSQWLKVKRIVKHKDYNNENYKNDIALIILFNRVTEDGVTVKSIYFATSTPPPGTKCTVVGWGNLYYMGPSPDEVLYVDVIIFGKSDCESTKFKFYDGMLCAGDKDDSEKDSCQGDSGGPLICNGNVSGIVSFGYLCATGIGFYTDVAFYTNWIRENSCYKLIPRKKYLLILPIIILVLYYIMYIIN